MSTNGQDQQQPQAPVTTFQPHHPPLGLYEAYIAKREIKLTVQGKIASSRGDFAVVDDEGRVVFVSHDDPDPVVKGAKHIADMNGQPLLTIAKDKSLLHKRYIVTNAKGEEIIKVGHNHKSVKTSIDAHFTNTSDSVAHELKVKGNWTSKAFDIALDSGAAVARVDRGVMQSWGQHYSVTIAEGVDIALVTAIVICLASSFVEEEVAVTEA
ncbi:hypothetical protein L198_07592 [Cryptococcus wingfieldii CBS 7118]|uniref:Uncharacterized protein n=1 Tax=Cryptococcus wingfieldii CBS 7118 TaxID=1295528 RepID=A0A1E3I9U7_9TREE|nr:hypothetical protein L198_07592 [Cryptococcus wingfieldii CBS 7118]ODN85268.1 hypothetical protein L198_07592 [Cryptococcus wingfieldii CBS 7118]